MTFTEDYLHMARIQLHNLNIDYNDEIYNKALIDIEDAVFRLHGWDKNLMRPFIYHLRYEIFPQICQES